MAATKRPPGFARGTEVRSQRAELRRAIEAGDVDGHEVLAGASERWEPVASEMPVVQLMALVIGGDRSAALIAAGGLLEERRIPVGSRTYALTVERRLEIAESLRRTAR